MTITLLRIAIHVLFLAAMIYIGLRNWAGQGWQYSMRTLLITITVVAVVFGMIGAALSY